MTLRNNEVITCQLQRHELDYYLYLVNENLEFCNWCETRQECPLCEANKEIRNKLEKILGNI